MKAAGKFYIVYPSRSDWIKIWNFADLHIGNAGTAIKKLKHDVSSVQDDPYSFWFGGGDYAEYITAKDKRFDPGSVAKDIKLFEMANLGKALSNRVRDTLFPIKKKGMGLLFGNHEAKYMTEKEQEDLHAWLCTELDLANFGYTVLFHVVFIRNPKIDKPTIYRKDPYKDSKDKFSRFGVTIFSHHGAGGAQSPGGKMNRLIKFMQDFRADLYFVGHVHDQIAKRLPEIGIDPSGTKILDKERIGVVTGSYLKTYEKDVTTYGEIKGYSPVPLGAIYAEIHPDSGKIKAAI